MRRQRTDRSNQPNQSNRSLVFWRSMTPCPDWDRNVYPGRNRTEVRDTGAVTICWEPPVRERPAL